MTSEKIGMTQRTMVEEEQARVGNQKWTQYLAALIGNNFFNRKIQLKNLMLFTYLFNA